MAGRVGTGTALSSEAVDVMFWALVCDDEEWLDLEFAGIVSEPAESPSSYGGGRVCGWIGSGRGRRCRREGFLSAVRADRQVGGCGVRRQRSPPP